MLHETLPRRLFCRLSFSRLVFSANACAKATPPLSPISLQEISSILSEIFLETNGLAKAIAPISPMLFICNSNSCKELTRDVNCSTMSLAPEGQFQYKNSLVTQVYD